MSQTEVLNKVKISISYTDKKHINCYNGKLSLASCDLFLTLVTESQDIIAYSPDNC